MGKIITILLLCLSTIGFAQKTEDLIKSDSIALEHYNFLTEDCKKIQVRYGTNTGQSCPVFLTEIQKGRIFYFYIQYVDGKLEDITLDEY